MELAQQSTQPNESQDQLTTLKNVAAHWLQIGIDLLQNNLKSDHQLTTISSLVPGGTVGKHLRHLHDHFRILLDVVDSPGRTLDYDSRRTNVPMETSVMVALNEFVALRDRLLNRTEQDRLIPHLDLPLCLSATTPHLLNFNTSFGRELWFASLHATHHYALIRVIVTAELGIPLPVEFGVAPSTMVNNGGSIKKDKPKM